MLIRWYLVILLIMVTIVAEILQIIELVQLIIVKLEDVRDKYTTRYVNQIKLS